MLNHLFLRVIFFQKTHPVNIKLLRTCIAILLFIVPFFWLKPGEVDLGGDASRLYYFDPISYLTNLNLYVISPQGTGPEFSYQFSIPFVVLLILLKSVFTSPTIIITLVNGINLSLGFLFISKILDEFFQEESSNEKIVSAVSIIGGLYYIFSPISIRGGWEKALFDHTQLFINPLVFWLILKYIHTKKTIFIVVFLLLSFVFSYHFSYSSAPKFFAFYIPALVYLGIYAKFIENRVISLKFAAIIIILFITIQFFHILPTLSNLVKPSTLVNYKIFSGQEKKDALNYFLGLTQSVKLSDNFLGLAPNAKSLLNFDFLFFIMPIIILFGSLINKNLISSRRMSVNYDILLLFFLIILFFITGKITDSGLNFYTLLFSFPGFVMFRSYFGQWAHAYVFFYTLIFSISLYYVLLSIQPIFRRMLYLFIFILILLSGFSLIKGDYINVLLTKSAGVEVRGIYKINPKYETVLDNIKQIQTDSKILDFPFVDDFYQILSGSDRGAYIGPSTIAYLTGKNDFGSSQILLPFTDPLLVAAKNRNYKIFQNIFPLLSIHYIFYNSDPYIYENFLDFPYQQMRQFMPTNQKLYTKFISRLPIVQEKDISKEFHIYKINPNLILPHIYSPKENIFYPKDDNSYILSNFVARNGEIRRLFLDKKDFDKFKNNGNTPLIYFVKINRTKYVIHIKDAKNPYFLVFQDAFNPDWNLFFSDISEGDQKTTVSYFGGKVTEGVHKDIFLNKETFETLRKQPIANRAHMVANGYANAWYITPADVGNKKEYTLILEMTSQRVFYLGLLISLITFVVCVLWLAVILWKTSKAKIGKVNIT